MKTIIKGETIICPANIEHWHGASPDSQMNHIAITNDKGLAVWSGSNPSRTRNTTLARRIKS